MGTKNKISTADKFLKKNLPYIDYMAGRWEDESEYENIEDYKNILQKAATPFGIVIDKMIAQPFGFKFRVKELKYQLISTPTKFKLQPLL